MSVLERTCKQATLTIYVDIQAWLVALFLAVVCYWASWTLQPVEHGHHSAEKWFHLAEAQTHPAKRRILYDFDPEEG